MLTDNTPKKAKAKKDTRPARSNPRDSGVKNNPVTQRSGPDSNATVGSTASVIPAAKLYVPPVRAAVVAAQAKPRPVAAAVVPVRTDFKGRIAALQSISEPVEKKRAAAAILADLKGAGYLDRQKAPSITPVKADLPEVPNAKAVLVAQGMTAAQLGKVGPKVLALPDGPVKDAEKSRLQKEIRRAVRQTKAHGSFDESKVGNLEDGGPVLKKGSIPASQLKPRAWYEARDNYNTGNVTVDHAHMPARPAGNPEDVKPGKATGKASAAPSAAGPAVHGSSNPDDGTDAWARHILKAGNFPVTSENVRFMSAWARAEGGHFVNDSKYNPLNTTQPEPGATNTGTQGNIKVYRSWGQGDKATLTTINNGKYPGIVAALKKGTSADAAAEALGSSPWGTTAAGIRAVLGSSGGGSVPAPVSSSSAAGGSYASSAGASAAPAGIPSAAGTTAATRNTTGKVTTAADTTTNTDARRAALAQFLMNRHDPGALLAAVASIPTAAAGTKTADTVYASKDWDGAKVAAWMVPVLKYAKAHGWNGTVKTASKSALDVTLTAGFKDALKGSRYETLFTSNGNKLARS